jgi:hypothetical protein
MAILLMSAWSEIVRTDGDLGIAMMGIILIRPPLAILLAGMALAWGSQRIPEDSMTRSEQLRADAHDIAADALVELNQRERRIDADCDIQLYAKEGFADLKRRIAETRDEITIEYRQLLAKIDAREKA